MGRFIKQTDIDLSPVLSGMEGLSSKMDRIWEQIKTPGAPPKSNVVMVGALRLGMELETPEA
ncbi:MULTISPECIES: hypothetical protein [Dethiosulfovibrio]|uniref:Uncharacterized protein n=2 Tax=Dethiosulfovibrio TaxID=47054 RepID=A0ABS9ER79_9BACT|nr:MULTISPECIES: hypothetical protein [Dethiosulfovibrio]MCF4115229.1 hypothetical protein [Dethiosulfovibrio russensis]MCF4143693.1 hypothetical protein [Dethiosulfovibrio marinus]MCF4146201.1 hypothetical protein [Dethiosulfovibrio acidaminovorans]